MTDFLYEEYFYLWLFLIPQGHRKITPKNGHGGYETLLVNVFGVAVRTHRGHAHTPRGYRIEDSAASPGGGIDTR